MITILKKSLRISLLVSTMIVVTNAQVFEEPLNVSTEKESYSQKTNSILQPFKELNKEAEKILEDINVYETEYAKASSEVKTIREILEAIEEMIQVNVLFDQTCKKESDKFKKNTLQEVNVYMNDPYLTDVERSQIEKDSSKAIRTSYDDCISKSSEMSSKEINLRNDVIKVYRDAVTAASTHKVSLAKLVAMRENVVALGKKYNILSSKIK